MGKQAKKLFYVALGPQLILQNFASTPIRCFGVAVSRPIIDELDKHLITGTKGYPHRFLQVDISYNIVAILLIYKRAIILFIK